ncbi:hypothetical protein D9758_005493 [Tetrapyrgos nigripes]|uniref:Reverse transcriptase Ty1/copia-type domain-containing protein n=1 Tax=Tetrapyrgos nigripes TaxID=182062 RepID=A0A8H5GHZ2_9AGAR|nr:hypothetical protein D9758_005493 [Tetrapyrgos nigripes]
MDWAMLVDEEEEENVWQMLEAHNMTISKPDNEFVPKTFKEAKERRDLWSEPMEKEIGKMETRKAWMPMDKPDGVKEIGVKWCYTLKRDSDGKIIERRARLVVKGYMQEKRVHYWDSWAVVARYESFRMIIAIATYLGLTLWSGNFASVYLNPKPQGRNYLALPPGFES